MSTNIAGTEETPLVWLLGGVGVLLGGLAFGGGWWILNGSPVGGLLVVVGVVLGSLLIAFGYA